MCGIIARALKEVPACDINENRHGHRLLLVIAMKAMNNSSIISKRNTSWTKPVIGMTNEQTVGTCKMHQVY